MFETELMRVVINEATQQNLRTKKEIVALARRIDKKEVLDKKHTDLIAKVVLDANRFPL